MNERQRVSIILLLCLIVMPLMGVYWILLGVAMNFNLTLLIPGVTYFAFPIWVGFRKVRYDSEALQRIRIEEAPPHIGQLLSETTNLGVLINQMIILTLDGKRGLSQTDLYKQLPIPPETCPTKERVRQYANILEEEQIIADKAQEYGEAKKKIYVLTKKGQWCVDAIEKYYPRYYFSFLVRNILKTHFRKNLPHYDLIAEDEARRNG